MEKVLEVREPIYVPGDPLCTISPPFPVQVCTGWVCFAGSGIKGIKITNPPPRNCSRDGDSGSDSHQPPAPVTVGRTRPLLNSELEADPEPRGKGSK